MRKAESVSYLEPDDEEEKSREEKRERGDKSDKSKKNGPTTESRANYKDSKKLAHRRATNSRDLSRRRERERERNL